MPETNFSNFFQQIKRIYQHLYLLHHPISLTVHLLCFFHFFHFTEGAFFTWPIEIGGTFFSHPKGSKYLLHFRGAQKEALFSVSRKRPNISCMFRVSKKRHFFQLPQKGKISLIFFRGSTFFTLGTSCFEPILPNLCQTRPNVFQTLRSRRETPPR